MSEITSKACILYIATSLFFLSKRAKKRSCINSMVSYNFQLELEPEPGQMTGPAPAKYPGSGRLQLRPRGSETLDNYNVGLQCLLLSMIRSRKNIVFACDFLKNSQSMS